MRRPIAWTSWAALMLSACSSAQPELYSNAHLQSVGKEVAEQDIQACKQLAESAGAEEGSGKAGRVATSTAVGGGVGAASGAVGGAISGAAGQGSARHLPGGRADLVFYVPSVVQHHHVGRVGAREGPAERSVERFPARLAKDR